MKQKNLFVLQALLILATGLFAQPLTITDSAVALITTNRKYYKLPEGKPYGETIQADRMKWLIDTLASDAMAGRETGEEGQRRAADFIAQEFENMGLPPVADRNTYFQYIQLKRESWKDISLKVDGQEFKDRTDFYAFPANNNSAPAVDLKDVVFVGYGIETKSYSDYGDTDVRGKAVLMYGGEPQDESGKFLASENEFRSAWSLDWKRKVRLATQKGAVMVFIIDPELKSSVRENRRALSSRGWRSSATMQDPADKGLVNSMFITPEVADAIMGKNSGKAAEALAGLRKGQGFKPVRVKTKIELEMTKNEYTLNGSNVIGFIEGSDPNLKNQYVFITAHYDHLGKVDDVIYNGADDNASGTAGVIAIAQAFAQAKKDGVGPKRSVVCMLVSGEEKGLLGSRFYVDFPLFPLDRTIVDINIDMIGRIDDRHADNPDYVYVIGSDRLSSELHEINEFSNNQYTKLELDYKYNDPNDPNRYYQRSDHYNFAERGIPAIFYFNGTHADYHKASDTREKIDPAAAAKRAQLAFYTAWDIANRPSPIAPDRK